MKNKQNIIKILIKVVLIFIIFEVFTRTVGSILTSNIWNSLNNGKYTRYFISEFVVLLCSLIFLKITNKTYIFKEKRMNFLESLKICLPIVILSILVFLANVTSLDLKNNIPNIISVIFYSISIGLFEEIFFRGIILNELLENYSTTKKETIVSIVLSGIIFGAVHLTNLLAGQDLLSTIMQFIQSMSIGILFATSYYLSKNIWALIFLHSFYDFSLLLGDVNLVTECSYVDNVPFSITASSIIVSIILSLIYLVYSVMIFIKRNNEENQNCKIIIYLLICLYFIFNIIFSFINTNIDDYYVCPNYEEKTIEKIETHYYGYDDYYYQDNDLNIHVYKDNDVVKIKDEINNLEINVDIKNVTRLVVIDDTIMIIAIDKTNYKLYFNKLTDLNNINNFKEFIIPASNAVGYLIDKDKDLKYPMIKSSNNSIYVIDENKLYLVKETS